MDVDEVADQLARNTLFPAFKIDFLTGDVISNGIDPSDEKSISSLIRNNGLGRVYPYTDEEYKRLMNNMIEFNEVTEGMGREGYSRSIFKDLRIARYILTSIISDY